MPIFNNSSQEELVKLANVAKIKRYKENSVVAKEGHRAQFLYIVTDGDCQSIKKINNDPYTIARLPHRAQRRLLLKVQELGEGMTFGETVLFDELDAHGLPLQILKYPASLVTPVYTEICVIPRESVSKVLGEATLTVLCETAKESQKLYNTEDIQHMYHRDNVWRRKRSKILKPLLSKEQYTLTIQNDENNMGLKPERSLF